MYRHNNTQSSLLCLDIKNTIKICMSSYLVTGAEGQLGKCFNKVANEFPIHKLIFASKNKVDITGIFKYACFIGPSTEVNKNTLKAFK